MVHAILDSVHNCDLLHLQTVTQYLAIGQRGRIKDDHHGISDHNGGGCGRDAIYASTYAAFLLFYGIRALLLHDGRNKIFLPFAPFLYK